MSSAAVDSYNASLHEGGGGRAGEPAEAAQTVSLECHSRLILEELSAMVDDEGSDYTSSSDEDDSDDDDDADSGGDGKAARKLKQKQDGVDALILNKEFSYHEAEMAPGSQVALGSSASNMCFRSGDIQSVESIMQTTPAGEQSLVRRRDAAVVEKTILRSGGKSGLFRSRSDAVIARGGNRDRVAGYMAAGPRYGSSTILSRVIKSASGRALSMCSAPAAGGQSSSHPSADNMGGSGTRRTGEHRVEKNADSWTMTTPGAVGGARGAGLKGAGDLTASPCPKRSSAGRAMLLGEPTSGSGSERAGHAHSRRASSSSIHRRGSSDSDAPSVGPTIVRRGSSSIRRGSSGACSGSAAAAAAAAVRRNSGDSLSSLLRDGEGVDSASSSASNLLLEGAPIDGMTFLSLLNDPTTRPAGAAAAVEAQQASALIASGTSPSSSKVASNGTTSAVAAVAAVGGAAAHPLPARRSSFGPESFEKTPDELAGDLEARFGESQVIPEEEDNSRTEGSD